MKNRFLAFLLVLSIVLPTCRDKAEEGARIVLVNGVPHVLNPELPPKGTVILELEELLRIDPYEREEVGLRAFVSVKDADREVILYDPNNAEIHRFDENGAYKGNLIRKGQGPGEFSPYSIIAVRFLRGQIWVTGRGKLAKFDKNGRFIEEFPILDSTALFIDGYHYLTEKTSRDPRNISKQVCLRMISKDNKVEEGTVLLEGENLGMIPGKDGSGFADEWATPDTRYAADPANGRIYLAVNTEYKVEVRDLAGKITRVIERPYHRIKISRSDKEAINEYILKLSIAKEILDLYPDELVAIKGIKCLPRGYLAVYRITGPKMFDVDIIDPEGRYVCIIKPPENVSIERATFYDFGFAIVEEREDIPVYVEYRIKNLPKIFGPE